MSKAYRHFKVIQGDFGFGHGWEDLDFHECNSKGKVKDPKALQDTLNEYRLSSDGAQYRVIQRREYIG